ncbi:DUF2461 domain-containing protein [Chlorobium limicola]
MLTTSILSFLGNLRANNTREWFDLHRLEYQEAYGDMLGLTSDLLREISCFDNAIEASGLDPESCIMRLHRDVRFSKDKSPYKTNFFVFISPGGRKSPFGGYYVHIGPEGESFAGGGVYMPEPAVLARLREEIDGHFSEWSSIVSSEVFLIAFPEGVLPSGMLKRPPKGYGTTSPAIEYLKYKGYYTRRFLSDAEVTSSGFVPRLVALFRTVKPMVDFLNRSAV